MTAPEEHLLRTYLDARFIVSRHLDDPSPVADAWTAQRAVELMLIRQGWTEEELDAAFASHEREQLLTLNMDGWRSHLVDALGQSTERSLRVAQALARYREPAGGKAD